MYPEAAGLQTKMGEILDFDANGNLVAMVASGTQITTASAARFLGVSLRNGKNLAAVDSTIVGKMPIELIDDQTILVLPLYAVLGTNAEWQDAPPGTKFAVKNVNGVYCIDTSVSGATGVVEILRRFSDYGPLAQFVPIECKVVRTMLRIE